MALIDPNGRKIEQEPKTEPFDSAKALTAKKKAFQLDPDKFISLDEVILCVIRKPGVGIGMATYVSPKATKDEYQKGLSGLVVAVGKVLAALKAKEGRIHVPRFRDIFRRR